MRHVSKEPRMAKMDPSAAYMAVAVWNGYVWDARRHARQWRPVEQALQGSKDVGLRARVRSRSFLCTVPMTGRKSRTLGLLAFDEYCRFDTSAFF